jgi:predicted Zn-dependent protease with MMP-like domain
MPLPFSTPPSLGDLEEIARRIFDSLPAFLTERCRDLVIQVEDFPADDVLDEMGIESPYDLAGLYQGVPLTEQQVSDPRPAIDMIFLYRRPLLDWWCDEGCDLEYLIRHVLVHEIGHHFGFSDADMERIEALADDDEPGGAIH